MKQAVARAGARLAHWLGPRRRPPAAAGPIALVQRRVFILPTQQGLLFAGLLLLMLVGSINYGNSLGYLLTFLLGGMGGVSMVHTYRNLVGVSVAVGRIEPVFCGESAAVPVLLQGAERMRLALRVASDGAARTLDLAPGEQATVTLRLPSPRRGRQQLGPLVLDTRFPLGLFRAWAPLRFEAGWLVYPRPAPHAPALAGTGGGEAAGGAAGEADEDFRGQRPYRAGDSPRRINWKAAARRQGWFTKEFDGARAAQYWVDWHGVAGETEARLSQLTAQVLAAAGDGRTYGLRLPGRVLGPGSGAAHRSRCLEAIALFEGAA